MSNNDWKRGVCGTCRNDYNRPDSTAKDWQRFCSKTCERVKQHGTGKGQTIYSNTPDDATMPRQTIDVQTTSPTHTTRDGGMGWNWPTSPIGKGQPITVKPYKTCVHDGHTVAFTLRGGEVTVYGARGASLMNPSNDLSHIDLIIDCAGIVTPKDRFVDGGARKYQALNMAIFPDVIRLRWPDMTAPSHVPLTFWVRLLATLPRNVCINCVGSHGRTGTAMAALLVADGWEAVAAIKEVRDKHCHHAIETAAQEAYIKALGKQQQQQMTAANTATKG